jgi:hypothetical protein
MPLSNWKINVSLLLLAMSGCSRGPSRFEAPEVDPSTAAAEAMELYDVNGDGALDDTELKKCPGLLLKKANYDKDTSGALSQAEIEGEMAQLFGHGTGGTQLRCFLTYQGRPLAGANVVMEPEPYLGEAVRAASATTDGAGTAQMAIPAEYLPSHLQRVKAVHYGTFKFRITHPTIAIPPKYNTETELGYETEINNPLVKFDLK